jgi:hypothetical protein
VLAEDDDVVTMMESRSCSPRLVRELETVVLPMAMSSIAEKKCMDR